jgi:energy-coupling factor transporter transmembrane protein EcfT
MNSNFSNVPKLSFSNDIKIYSLISLILLYIGFVWKNVFKSLSKISISFAAIFLFLAIFNYSIYIHTDNLTNSIQNSIDQVIYEYGISYLENQSKGDFSLTFIIGNETKLTLYNKNLTYKQANLFLNLINLNEKTYTREDKIKLTKIIISLIHKNLNTYGLNSNEYIPIDVLNNFKSELSTINLTTLLKFSEPELENLQIIDQNGYIKISYLNNSKTIKYDSSTNNKTIINEIWKELNFNKSVSYTTKQKTLNLIFSYVSQNEEFKNYDLNKYKIPLNLVSENIPNNVKQLTNYDLFNSNKTIAIQNLNKIRNDCENKKLNFTEICSVINLTKYENIIKSINKSLNNESNEFSENNIINISKYDSLNKLNTQIKNKTSKYTSEIIYFVILMIISYILFLIHTKYIEDKISFSETNYFISKHLLINWIFFELFFIAVYYLFKEEILSDLINNGLSTLNITINIQNLPTYIVLNNIIYDMYKISLIISAAITLIFLICFGYNKFFKKEDDNLPDKETLDMIEEEKKEKEKNQETEEKKE